MSKNALIKCKINKAVRLRESLIINAAVISLLFFIAQNSFAGQSFISASFLSGEDETKESSLNIGTSVFKDGTFSVDYAKTKYISDDEELETTFFGLNYGHTLNKYFEFGLGANQSKEPDYIIKRETAGSVTININHLWSGLYKTSISLDSSRQVNSYEREFTSKTIEQEITQTGTSITLEQEIRTWLVVGVGVTQYSYDEDPADYTNSYPLLMRFIPEFESMLYSFLDKSEQIYLVFDYADWTFDLSASRSLSLIDQDYDQTYSLVITYYFDAFDISVGHNRIKLVDTEYGQTSLGLGYSF